MSAPAAAANTVATKTAAPPAVQQRVRLVVGGEGDSAEREADRFADGVLARRPVSLSTALPRVETPRALGFAPLSVDDTLAEPGEPLDYSLRDRLGGRLGHDLSRVRIHRGPRADRSTRDLDAEAYAIGNDVVFRQGRYAPDTPTGQHILAHELAHVIQHRANEGTTAPIVRRYGRTARGFFANLFQFWSYSKETLDRYLKVLETANRIEDDDDSDDKARQVTAEWKTDKSRYALTPVLKMLLVREMLSGFVSGADQDAILDLLEGTTNTELAQMFRAGSQPLTYAEIVAQFGSRKARLEFFEKRVLRTLSDVEPPPAGGKSAQERLDDLEKQQGIAIQQLAVRFYLSAGDLYSSFAVNLTVPAGGIWVSVSLTRAGLKVSLSPSLLVDVAWPLSSADMTGFTLTFAGLKPKLDIQGGLELIATKAQSEVERYLQGILVGTRFAAPGYDPSRDPQLIGEVLDNTLVGDVNRVKYNFEKNLKPSQGGDSSLADKISAPSITLDLVHTKGIAPTTGWNVVVAPGTPFTLQIDLVATGAELKEKNAQLRKLTLTSGGIYVYKNKQKIVGLKQIEMGPRFDVKLVGVEAFVDLKELLKREYPGKFSDTVAGALKTVDQVADALDAIASLGGLAREREPPADSALALATSLSETVFGLAVEYMLRGSWRDIKNALGVTDQQLLRFFGGR